jgi:hypothetical protein
MGVSKGNSLSTLQPHPTVIHTAQEVANIMLAYLDALDDQGQPVRKYLVPSSNREMLKIGHALLGHGCGAVKVG